MSNNSLLQPSIVFDCFAEVNKVPRPSKKEEKMIAFLQAFGEGLGLPTKVDETGNVCISKPATPGHEHRKTVILQSHMDMVCEKNKDVDFNFETDAIQTYIDGEWLCAKGTTLGADDGIGVAMQMAILQSTDIEHGPIQCVFTRDEETGLTGAMGMKNDFMQGDYLINLDSEDEGQIFVSCAGGVRTTATYPFPTEEVPAGYYTFRVGVKGLTGGHSGDDINKKRGNANKILVRFLCNEMEKTDLRLIDIQSGGLHNAIPREGYALCAVPADQKEQMRIDLNILSVAVEEEYSVTEKSLLFTLDSCEASAVAMERQAMRRMLLSLQVVHNGVFAMSQDMEGLVETSSNLASIHLEGDRVVVTTSQRSSVGSACQHMASVVRAAFELGGAEVLTNEGYPGWKLNPNSEIVKIAKESYVSLFGKEPLVLAIHAGLECGLFSEKYPNLDMVSFGPTLRGVHSPDERLLIPTVQMVWDHLLDILKRV
ncbi:aminoacyl-histidine dipeptidase (Peptidase D) [gut metagenome]|uniref:Aminoacyl-histidine dipeptidase (Peptidase D) n=1 Tax=gut metagenome TaxID=749906 RepID=J9GLN5_9ZZZZ